MNTVIHTGSPDIARSKDFFTKLDFHELLAEDSIYFVDGNFIIEVKEDHFARPGIKMYGENWAKKLDEWSFTWINPEEGLYILRDPNGVWVYLEEGKGPNMPAELSGKPSAVGTCMGVSIETLDPLVSLVFWQNLGFKVQMGSAEQGFMVLQNEEGFGLSMMKAWSCPHTFLTPSLTYFNGKKNPEIIKGIRDKGISMEEEVSVFNEEGIVDNIIIREPGGYGFFVFND